MLLTYYFLNISCIGWYYWKVNMQECFKSILAVAICLASCILVITSIFGRLQYVYQDDGINGFEVYHFCIIHVWNPLMKLLAKSNHDCSTQFVSNCPICGNLCDWLKLNHLEVLSLCVIIWVNSRLICVIFITLISMHCPDDLFFQK